MAVRKDFGLTCHDKDNETPLCIQRAPLDTHERYIGESQSGGLRREIVAGGCEQIGETEFADERRQRGAGILQTQKSSTTFEITGSWLARGTRPSPTATRD